MQDNLSTFNSKKSISVHFIKFVIFTVCLYFFCAYLGRSYLSAADKNLISAWNQQRFNNFYNMEDGSVDMVFIGSSHSYCTFDPLLIDAHLGTNGYQMGMPLQMPDGTYYTLIDILNHQTPTTVVMEVYWKLLDKEFDLKQAETLFQVMGDEALKNEYIRKGFSINERAKYYIPFIRFQQDFFAYKNKELLSYFDEVHGLTKTTEAQEGIEYINPKGFMYCDYNIPPSKYGNGNQFIGFDGKTWSIHQRQQHYLDMIVNLCKEKEIQLIFVTAPVANISLEKIKNYGIVHDTIADYAANNSIPYLDFNVTENLFDNSNFRDDAHLNYSGAVIACEYFSQFFKTLH